jgi:hypothetical protein
VRHHHQRPAVLLAVSGRLIDVRRLRMVSGGATLLEQSNTGTTALAIYGMADATVEPLLARVDALALTAIRLTLGSDTHWRLDRMREVG